MCKLSYIKYSAVPRATTTTEKFVLLLVANIQNESCSAGPALECDKITNKNFDIAVSL